MSKDTLAIRMVENLLNQMNENDDATVGCRALCSSVDNCRSCLFRGDAEERRKSAQRVLKAITSSSNTQDE